MSQVNQSVDPAGRHPTTARSPSQPPGSMRRTLPAPPPAAYEDMAVDLLPPSDSWIQDFGDVAHDADSALGAEDPASSAQSLTWSTFQFRTIYGRAYHGVHGTAQYWYCDGGSNDDKQRNAMDMTHHTLTLACGDKLFKAPLDTKKISKVLDVGTGTGVWAIDFADENPHIEVIGTDLSPIQPFWVSPNLKFEIEDCTQDWTYPSNSFDYVHMRWLFGSIKDWPALFEQSFKACKPGGWVESFEPSPILLSDDKSVSEDSALGRWGRLFTEGGKRLGASFNVVDEGIQELGMKAAGFVDIGTYSFKSPLGEWPKDQRLKEMGRFAQSALISDIEGVILYTALTLGWTKDEIDAYVAQLEREMLSRRHRPYYWQRVVWGRKPMTA